MDRGRREAEHGKVDHKESSDDEEVELISHRKGACGTDPPGANIHDTPETSDTQRDEWLFRMEPLQEAGPRWDEDGQSPVVFDQMGVVDIEAAGGLVSRNVEQRGAPSPMLPPEQRILQEEEVRTPPRKEAHGHGSHQAPAHQLPQTQVVPQFVTDVWARYVGPDQQSGSWSLGNVLEDTVARMQQDLADIRGVQPVVPTPGRRPLRLPKYLGLVGRPVGSSISRSLML